MKVALLTKRRFGHRLRFVWTRRHFHVSRADDAHFIWVPFIMKGPRCRFPRPITKHPCATRENAETGAARKAKRSLAASPPDSL